MKRLTSKAGNDMEKLKLTRSKCLEIAKNTKFAISEICLIIDCEKEAPNAEETKDATIKNLERLTSGYKEAVDYCIDNDDVECAKKIVNDIRPHLSGLGKIFGKTRFKKDYFPYWSYVANNTRFLREFFKDRISENPQQANTALTTQTNIQGVNATPTTQPTATKVNAALIAQTSFLHYNSQLSDEKLKDIYVDLVENGYLSEKDSTIKQWIYVCTGREMLSKKRL